LTKQAKRARIGGQPKDTADSLIVLDLWASEMQVRRKQLLHHWQGNPMVLAWLTRRRDSRLLTLHFHEFRYSPLLHRRYRLLLPLQRHPKHNQGLLADLVYLQSHKLCGQVVVTNLSGHLKSLNKLQLCPQNGLTLLEVGSPLF
jgi:hypothetical protein